MSEAEAEEERRQQHGRERRRGCRIGPPAGMAPEAALGRPAHLEGLTRAKNLVEIAVTQIVRDDKQPRVVFSEAEMDDLVQSVTARGVLQPIRVRWNTDLGKYVIVAGEHRQFRAARQAGLRAVPCVIHEGAMTESTILQDQLVENLLRQDLQPIETAKAYCRLMELEGWSARQLARELHVPDANIVRALALLELPETVQQQVADGRLAPSVAYEVSKLDRPEDQAELAEAQVVTEKLTRNQAIEAVKVKKPGRAEMPKRTRRSGWMTATGSRSRARPSPSAARAAIRTGQSWHAPLNSSTPRTTTRPGTRPPDGQGRASQGWSGATPGHGPPFFYAGLPRVCPACGGRTCTARGAIRVVGTPPGRWLPGS